MQLRRATAAAKARRSPQRECECSVALPAFCDRFWRRSWPIPVYVRGCQGLLLPAPQPFFESPPDSSLLGAP